MEQKLRILHNTLMTIETKGESTKTMSQCLAYTENLIREAAEVASELAETKSKLSAVQTELEAANGGATEGDNT